MATVTTGTLKGYSLNMMTYLPTNYDSTKAYPLLCYLVGAGEIGVDPTKMLVNGPFVYLKAGVDLGLNLIVVTIQYQNQDPQPSEAQKYITALKTMYNISAFIGTGISRGSQTWDWFIGNAESQLEEMAALAIASSEGPVTDEPGIAGGWYPAWFLANNIPYWAACGDQDPFYATTSPYCVLNRYNSLKAAAPKLAFLDVWKGVGHGNPVWSDFYNPAWISPTMGKSLYAWASSFGALAVVAPPPVVVAPPPVVVAPTIYKSAVASGSYVKNNCVCGQGTSVAYTVLAGKYTSTVSQVAADAQATADVVANGQSYANANGTCTAVLVMDLQIFSDGSMIKTINGVATKIQP